MPLYSKMSTYLTILTVFISFQNALLPNSYGVHVSGRQVHSGRSGRDRPMHSNLRLLLQGPTIA